MEIKSPSGQERAGKGPKSKLPARPWLLHGLTLATLLGVFALFFLVYAPSRADYLINRNFRLLGDMSRQISDAADNINTALINILTNKSGAFAARVDKIVPRVTVSPGNFQPCAIGIQICRLDLEREDGTESLVLTYSNNRDGTNETPKTSTFHTNCFKASVDLGELLPPILSRSDFADILVSEAGGAVIFQLAQAENPVTNATAVSQLQIIKLPKFSKVDGTNLAARGTCLLEIKVAGVPYKLFAQPLRISPKDAPDAPTNYWLSGLVRTRDFAVQTREISSTTTIAFIFTALALILLWPFLNIVYCGPTSDLHRWEVGWVLLASFFGCAISVFVVLYSNTYLSSERRSNDDLDRLAGQVQTNLVAELKQVDQLLAKLDQNFFEAAEYSNDWSEVRVRTNIFSNLDAGEYENLYPAILEVFWARDGQQVAKWSPRNTTTPCVPIGDRAYFQSISGQWAWSWSAFTNPTPRTLRASPSQDSFYLDSIFSRTRSENEAAFARPFNVTYRTNWPHGPSAKATNYFGSPAVSVITFRPLSLFSPVLPAGYGFCLVDGTGQVLFHSDFRRNLRENFFTEVGVNPTLAAAVYARTPDRLDVRYYNKIYHASVTPVKGLPWTIIAFRNEQVLDGVHRNILLITGTLFGIYVLILLLLLLLRVMFVRSRGDSVLGWLWLNPVEGERHRDWAFLVDQAAIVLGLVCLAMIPAFVCYRCAFAREMSAYVKATELQVAREMEYRSIANRVRNWKWSNGDGGTNYWQRLQYFRSTNSLNRYLGFFCHMDAMDCSDNPPTGASSPLAHSSTWFDRLYGACRPHFAESELTISDMDHPCAEDESWDGFPTNTEVTLTFEGGQSSGDPGSILLKAQVPPMTWLKIWPFAELESEIGWHFLWYLGFLGVIFTPLVISRFVARNLLLCGLPSELRNTRSSGHILLVGSLQTPVGANLLESPFIVTESTRVRLLRKGETAKKHLPCETGMVLFIPKNITQNECKEILETSECRNLVAVLRSRAQWSGDCWQLTVPKAKTRSSDWKLPQTRDKDQLIRLRVSWTLHQAYSELWQNCSALEKLTLHQVARNGFVSARRPEIRTLLDRGLLRFAPELCLRNESFGRFVLAVFGPEDMDEVAESQHPKAFLTWESLRAPIGVAITAAAMFLFATQRELWQLALGLAGSFATASQGLSKISEAFGKPTMNKDDDQNGGG